MTSYRVDVAEGRSSNRIWRTGSLRFTYAEAIAFCRENYTPKQAKVVFCDQPPNATYEPGSVATLIKDKLNG